MPLAVLKALLLVVMPVIHWHWQWQRSGQNLKRHWQLEPFTVTGKLVCHSQPEASLRLRSLSLRLRVRLGDPGRCHWQSRCHWQWWAAVKAPAGAYGQPHCHGQCPALTGRLNQRLLSSATGTRHQPEHCSALIPTGTAYKRRRQENLSLRLRLVGQGSETSAAGGGTQQLH